MLFSIGDHNGSLLQKGSSITILNSKLVVYILSTFNYLRNPFFFKTSTQIQYSKNFIQRKRVCIVIRNNYAK